MSLWVCSKWNEKPTDAEKWEVDDRPGAFYVTTYRDDHYAGYLPKSDYRPCEPPAPPERWEDISEQCEAGYRTFTGPSAVWNVSLKMPDKNEGYAFRLRKVQLYLARPDSEQNCMRWAFVVEKKVTS